MYYKATIYFILFAARHVNNDDRRERAIYFLQIANSTTYICFSMRMLVDNFQVWKW